jgi:cytochrome P450
MLVDKADAFSRDELTHRVLTPVIGRTSLFLAEGPDWRWQRRAVAPIFRHEMLLSFVPTIAVIAERQVERWRARPLDLPVEIAAAMTRTTFEIIVDAILGGSARLDAERYGRALAATVNTIPWHLLLSVLWAPAWTPFPGRWGARRAHDFLRADIGRIIAKRRANPSAHPDLLDLLLAARDADTDRGLNDAELVANLLTFISAGHETTAVALTWSLWLLAKDEAVQRRVYDEAVAVMGHGPVEIAHIDALRLTRQVISESMRLFPPVPMLSRIPKTDMQLGGMAITPRTWVVIPIFALHRNALLWDNPHAFDPDRFAPDQAKGRSRYAHLPFGAGPRVCIGANFAMIEAVVIIATLVRAFRFQTVPGHKARPIARLTLRPAGGIPLLISAREQ